MVKTILPLNVTDIVVRKRGVRLLGPVSAKIDADGFTIVMGPNGAGKSTLLRALHGMERLAGGSVVWALPNKTAQRRQAFVFQTPTLMRRSVVENVAYPLLVQGMRRAEAIEVAMSWLTRVGLADMAQHRASYLSGGERQKMALVRALVRDPEVLFLDEPCANLDGRATRDIEELLHAVNEAGTRIVMSTHDFGQARRLASEVWFMHRGVMLEATPAEAFFDQPETPQAQAFLNGEIVE